LREFALLYLILRINAVYLAIILELQRSWNGEIPIKTPLSTLIITCIAIFMVGILSGAIGPILPTLSGHLSVSVETLGIIFTAMFFGTLTGQFAGGWVNDRIGMRNLLMVGAGLMAVGILGISVSPSLAVLLVCGYVAGVGQGSLDISTNVLVSSVYNEKRAVSAVNFLHFAFGAGAVVSPILASLAQSRWGTTLPSLWIGVALGVLTVPLALLFALNPPAPKAAAGETKGSAIYGRMELWVLGFILFMYVGAEMGFGSWSTLYLGKTTPLASGTIALLVSGYWLALTAGRLFGTVFGARLGSRLLLTIALVGSTLGGILLLFSAGNVTLSIAAIVVLGVSYGPVFPTTVVIATELFRGSSSRAVSTVVSLSSLGGMLLPPLQGLLLARVSPWASMALVAVEGFLMLALLVFIQSRSARVNQPLSAAGDK
jgi:MFS transporter, FHS family, L-fucose permease